MSVPLPRHTLVHRDGRRLFVYGRLHGAIPPDAPVMEPAALHERRDLLTGDWVAVSPARNTRPQTAPDRSPAGSSQTGTSQATPPRSAAHPECPLCPGGPEVAFDYEAAVFENRFPSFVAHPLPWEGREDDADLVRPSFGRCEVVLYTSAHTGSLGTLDPGEVARVVAIWRDRSLDLWRDPRHAFVLVFENRGEGVGATLSHPHGQIYAFDHLPPITARRAVALQRHREATGGCLHCELVARDDRAPQRRVATNDTFVVSVPFAARWPYEVHVRARRHGLRRLGDLRGHELRDLAQALQEVVRRYDGLFDFELPYMMVAQEAPSGADGSAEPDWHLSFEFLPPHRSAGKLKVRASVETATGLFINDTLPESSAAQLAAVAVASPDWDTVAVPAVTPVDEQVAT